MENPLISFNLHTLVTVNAPLLIYNIVTNVFFEWCLVFSPKNGQKLKQPLKMLLGLLVTYSIMYCITVTFLLVMVDRSNNFHISLLWLICLFFLRSSMACSAWLSFYFYIKIVPAQRTFFIWVKKHITTVIVWILIFDGMLFFFSAAVDFANVLIPNSNLTDFNSTSSDYNKNGLFITRDVVFILIRFHIVISLLIMTWCSFSTIQYLHQHVKNVVMGGTISCPKVRSQIRVTICGMCHAVTYFLYNTFYLLQSLCYNYCANFVLNPLLTFTMTLVYISSSTVYIGYGQAVFRLRTESIWRKLKALFDVGMETNGVRGEKADTADVQTSL